MRSGFLMVFVHGGSFRRVAQIDLSGEWNNVFHEDQPERIPGPEIGDYLGLPITDAARMRGDIWDAGNSHAARAPVQAAPGRDYGAPRAFQRAGSGRRSIHRRSRSSRRGTRTAPGRLPNEPSTMDGRPHPPGTRRTLGRDSPPGSGTATFSRSPPRTSRPAGSGGTVSPAATGPR